MASDAATRFYLASHETNSGRGPAEPVAEDISQPRHRYYGARREILRSKPQAVLEMGYGSVGSVKAVAALGSFSYEITDIVDRLNGIALPPNVKHRTCNLDNDFPFEDGSFELVVALMIVEHLYDPFHAVAEIARVLKPGGRLVMNLPNIASLKCRLQLLAGRMPVTSSRDWFEKREWDGNHLHYFTVSDVRRLCEASGLRFVEMLPVGGMIPLKRLAPSLLCHEITYVLDKA